MTASAPVPGAVTPISGRRQVTFHQCLTISCAVCDLAAWNEYVIHFDSERELRGWISGQGWTVRLGRHSALPAPATRRSSTAIASAAPQVTGGSSDISGNRAQRSDSPRTFPTNRSITPTGGRP
jgi:hypothetical protein